MLAVILGAPVPAMALVVYDENISGDLTNLDMPIQFTLRTGSNEIIGAVQSPFDVFDPFAFTVLRGQQLDALILLLLLRPVAITLFAGPIPLVPNDIGGVVAQPSDVGRDLLPLMGLPPLSTGVYSVRIFAGFELEHPYRIDLRVSSVPEPTTLILVSIGLAGFLVARGWKRRHHSKPGPRNHPTRPLDWLPAAEQDGVNPASHRW